MSLSTRSGIAAAFICAGLAWPLFSPTAALANPVTVAFNISSTISSAGSPEFYAVGTTGTGSFTFDDSLIPAAGSGLVGNGILGAPTLALTFNWFGVDFSVANASISTLSFSNGTLTDWSLGGRYAPAACGLMRYTCLHSSGAEADFILSPTNGGSLNDGVHAGIGSGYGTVKWQLVSAPVPEPSTLATMVLGTLGLALRRRAGAQATRARG